MLWQSTEQMIKSLASVTSVCPLSYGCNSQSILMKLWTVVWNPAKSTIEFVKVPKSDRSSLFSQFLTPQCVFNGKVRQQAILDTLITMMLRRSTSWFETGKSRRRQIRSSERLPGEDAREENWRLSGHSVRSAADRKPSLPTPGAAQWYIRRVRRHRAAANLFPDINPSTRCRSEQYERGLSLPQHLETRRPSQERGYGKLTLTYNVIIS